MKVYKLTVMVIDHDEIGDDVVDELENGRFANGCISPDVMGFESREIGEWDDDCALNGIGRKEEFARLFGSEEK